MGFKSKFRNLFKGLTWRFFPYPDELSIKSVLETILYVVIFSFCWYLFICWNQVPIRQESFYVDCLVAPSDDRIEDIAPIANICYCVPMTTTGWEPMKETSVFQLPMLKDEKNEHSEWTKNSPIMIYPYERLTSVPGVWIEFSQWRTSSRKNSINNLIVQDNNLSPTHVDSVKNVESHKSKFWEYAFDSIKGYPYNPVYYNLILPSDAYFENMEYSKLLNTRYILWEDKRKEKLVGKYDSLRNHLFETPFFAQAKAKGFEPIYYYGVESSKLPMKRYKDKTFETIDANVMKVSHQRETGEGQILVDGFISGNYGSNVSIVLRESGSGILADSKFSKPSWFRLEDISQSYYDIRLGSVLIDSITLKFDFIGATNFSKIRPEPDNVTMSSIEFTDPSKIMEIRTNGLKFYAKFIELENKQFIRMFVITTILGAMFMIFIGMLFVCIIKLIAFYYLKKRS